MSEDDPHRNMVDIMSAIASPETYTYFTIFVAEKEKAESELQLCRKHLARGVRLEAALVNDIQDLEAERDRLKEELAICRGATETEVSTAYRLERDRLQAEADNQPFIAAEVSNLSDRVDDLEQRLKNAEAERDRLRTALECIRDVHYKDFGKVAIGLKSIARKALEGKYNE